MKDRTHRNSFYSRADWKALAARVRRQWLAQGKPCGYCGNSLEGKRVICDHIINRQQRPDLALEPSNIQCVCWGCNSKKYHHVEINDKPQTGADGFPIGSEWS